MRRSRILVASTALGASLLLGGCGGGTEAYCEDLRSAEEQFSSFGDDAAQFEEAVATFRELGEEAPDEVADDWEAFLGAFDELEAALNDAGIELSDLEEIQQGNLPEGVSQEDLRALGTEIEALSDGTVEKAGSAIEEHAKTECDVDLSGS